MKTYRSSRIIICLALSFLLVGEPLVMGSSYASEDSAELGSDENLQAVEECLELPDEDAAAAIEDIDEDSYDGFLFFVDEDTTGQEEREIQQEIKDLDKGQEAEQIADDCYYADSLETISEVVSAEQLESVEPNYLASLEDYDVKELYGDSEDYYSYYLRNQYGYNVGQTVDVSQVKLDQAWNRGVFGQTAGDQAVKVAVLDTLYYTNHEDLKGKVLPGYSLIGNQSVGDDMGHGTAVAGVIAAEHNNKGVLGCMPELKILPIRIFSRNKSAAVSDVIDALNCAKEAGADVVNMSFTFSTIGEYSWNILEEKCEELTDEGIILVAANGNSSMLNLITSERVPACYDCVTGVCAVDKQGKWAEFSVHNYGSYVTAPGDDIILLSKDGGYCKESGTSFSCPVVAALAGMCKAIDGSITNDQFQTLLRESSQDLGDPGYDELYGWGLVDFDAACDSLLSEKSELSDAELVIDKDEIWVGQNNKVEASVILGGNPLREGSDYKLIYQNVDAVGTARVLAVGLNDYAGLLRGSYRIKLKGTRLTNASRGKHFITVRWRRLSEKLNGSRISGYVVQVSNDKDFETVTRSSYRSGYDKYRRKFTGLKRKTNYYVRVRTVKNINGKRYYSDWSEVRRVRTK